MPIKKTRLSRKSKRFMKKMLSRKKTKKNKKNNLKSRTSRSKTSYKKSNSLKIRNKRNMKLHNGGFFSSSSCNIATIKEPGFSIDALGTISGINIPSSKAAIYRPNCGTGSQQAMAP